MGIGCWRRLTDRDQQRYICWEGHKKGPGGSVGKIMGAWGIGQ